MGRDRKPLISERVMVCMSASVDAPRVIDAGARFARRIGAPWYAVYVETPAETPDRITPRDADALKQNMQVAEALGATLVRVRAARTSDGLIAFARREGITHAIFGRTARSRLELLMKGSTIDRFATVIRDAAVHVVTDDDV